MHDLRNIQGKLVTLFGGGGFLGKYIAQHLLSAGARVRVAERDIQDARHIRPLGNLGQTQFVAADVRKPESLYRAMHGADMAVNLVGILKGEFDAIHREGAANVARAARDADCEALVHISAIGADPQSASAYGRSKGDGENEVRRIFSHATVLRPSVVFGREDDFINRFAAIIASSGLPPIMAPQTRFQPVYVDNVAEAVFASLAGHEHHGGKLYQLGGPEIVTMRDLYSRIAAELGKPAKFLTIPNGFASLLASLPGTPITRDQWQMLQQDNVVGDNAQGLDAFDITPVPMAAVIPEYLVQYRKSGRFGSKIRLKHS